MRVGLVKRARNVELWDRLLLFDERGCTEASVAEIGAVEGTGDLKFVLYGSNDRHIGETEIDPEELVVVGGDWV